MSWRLSVLSQFCQYSPWIPLSLISFSHSSHTASSPSVFFCIFLFHKWKHCQSLQLPSALLSVTAIKDVTNPVDYASSATNSTNPTRKSVPGLSGSRPCGPSGSQGLAVSSWHGLEDRDSWDPWPPGLLQPTHHHQQPIKTRSFPPQTLRKSLQVPSHLSNCCFILGHKTELHSNPWLSLTTSSSKWVVWINHWFNR